MKTTKPKSYSLFSTLQNEILNEAGIRRADLLRLADQIALQMDAVSLDSAHGTWLVAVKTPLVFAASMVACWRHHKVPVISADLQADTLKELALQLDGVIAEERLNGVNLPCVIPNFVAAEMQSEETIINPVFDAQGIAVVLYTSGSTGKKKRLEKPFFALFEELFNLEREYGNRVRGLCRRTTVSHFHIYGFLFNILWPLHFGHRLSAETTFYWEQVLHQGENGACIVSSPAHLRFLCSAAAETTFGWDSSVIFSSGGPLDRAVAVEIDTQTGCCPIEVFGSTETGGIAWRCQNFPEEVSFKAFNGVEVKQNAVGGLEVRADWTGMGDRWVETGDLVEFKTERHFVLRGRYDTVVKIAGKRVSLTEMEQRIQAIGGVESVRVFQFEDDSRQSRSALAVVIAVGAAASVPTGAAKAAQVKLLKQQLRGHFDLVTLPRAWRFVEEMPKNSQGKTTLHMLRRIVENG